jgi:prepilin signal peptidase PulO-like enzyme (type II secretory pathway)
MQVVFATILGSVVGSFLNLCIDRLPRGESLLQPQSHCDACRRRLAINELIPVFSYLILGGRCRTCNAQVPMRALLIELGTGILFGLIQLRFGTSLAAVLVAVYSSILIIALGVDLEHHKILNRLTYPAILLALPTGPLIGDAGLGETLIGGGLGLLSLVLIGLAYPGGMGMGDAKLAAFIGLTVGFPQVILALLLAFVSGGIMAGTLVATRRLTRDEPIAFAPFLATGAITTMLYGQQILQFWSRGI